MKIRYISIIIVGFTILFSGCSDFLTPDKDNVYTENEILNDPSYAEGTLLSAYIGLPGFPGFTEVATDDAVSNANTNIYRLAANGEWKSTNNPFDAWTGAYKNIAYINLFLKTVDNIKWSYKSEWQNEHYKIRLRAEACGLRAFYQYMLLQAHAGKEMGGNLVGFPIVSESVDINDDWQNMPRAGYDACVSQILSDLEIAINGLPDLYQDAPSADPQKSDKDAVYGSRFLNRMNARAAKLLKARVLLHAASPAYNPGNDLTRWANAADAAAEVIDAFGGVASMNANRITYYLGENTPDILWRKDYLDNKILEEDNFPPSLYGNGRVNPTQNFVDDFPTKDGFPISTNPASFNPNNPYNDRDPRLANYVVYNNAQLKSTTINTINGTKDGINMIAEASTRTGYYLKKMLNGNVNLTPGASAPGVRHFVTLMRYTEAFLIYAEAANEAWGPDGKGTHAYSAREVLAKIRSTGGISPDNYIATVAGDNDMRKLIHTERRIELSFEGFRFWDIRRWNNISKMKEPARGTSDGGLTSFTVENRVYEDYMIYGPVPDSEVKKGLTQNKSW